MNKLKSLIRLIERARTLGYYQAEKYIEGKLMSEISRHDCVKSVKEIIDGYTIWRFFYSDGSIEILRMRVEK